MLNQVIMDNASAVYKFVKQNHGRFATVTFRKRTNNEIRTINGRLGVKKFTSGDGKKFDDADKGLITIAEVKPLRDCKGRFIKGGTMQYRSFGVESVINIRMNKQEIVVPTNY